MHYHNVFLTKGFSKNNVVNRVTAFLESYRNIEFDWYQIGGRWSWSELIKKHKDDISREKEGSMRVYRTDIDNEVKVHLPNGDTVISPVGMALETNLKRWIDNNPTYSEVLKATEDRFWYEIKGYYNRRNNMMKELKENLRITKEEKRKNSLASYYTEQLEALKHMSYNPTRLTNKSNNWFIEIGFWNIFSNNMSIPTDTIKENPEEWFLVNLDIHT